MPDYYAPDHDWFVKNNLTPPSIAPHGTEEDIRSKLTPMKFIKWRQEGNHLIGTTELGEVANIIPTDMLLSGMDDKGMPILVKIKH